MTMYLYYTLRKELSGCIVEAIFRKVRIPTLTGVTGKTFCTFEVCFIFKTMLDFSIFFLEIYDFRIVESLRDCFYNEVSN